MNVRRIILIFACAAVALCAAGLAACAKIGYDVNRSVPELNKNDVLFIERNRLSFALGMQIDAPDVIGRCNISFVNDDGSSFKVTAQSLRDGTVEYENFELDETGSNKQIAISYGDAVNYIYYDVNSYEANFYLDEGQTELYKSVTASAELTDTLGLSVWVNLVQQNYSTDEQMRDADEDRTSKFDGWYEGSARVTGLYVFSPPRSGNERVVNFHAGYLSDEQLAEMNVYYDDGGRRVFAGYSGSGDSVRVPEGVTYVDFSELFSSGSSFRELIIPSTAATDAPFMAGVNSVGLERIEVDSGNRQYASYNGAMYSKDYSTLYFMPSDCTNTEFHYKLSEIASYACAYWRVTALNIPASVTVLHHYCFAYSLLTDVQGLENVRTIKAGVFYGANTNSFTDGTAQYIVLGGEDGSRLILSMMLDETATSYRLAAGTIGIASNAFSRCALLKSLELCDGLESISGSAFSGCESLESIALPSSLKRMGSSVFYDCKSLKTVTGLNAGIIYVDDDGNEHEHTLPASIFYGCDALTEVELPYGLLHISSSAFSGCVSLPFIDIPDTVADIGSSAFSSCSSLSSVSLPASLNSLGSSVFYNSGLASVDLTACPKLTTLPSSCFRGSKLTEVVIPDAIKSIPSYCFYNISTLQRVNLNKVTSVSTYAFGQNAELTDIDFGALVTVGTSAFRSCTALKKVVLPDSVRTVGGYAFASCSELESITLGKGVTSFGSYAFESDGVTFGTVSPVLYLCTSLKEIKVSAENGYFISTDGALYGKSVAGKNFGAGGVLYCVPSGFSGASYTSATATRVILPYAVHSQENLVSFNCNEGLVNIGKGAFYNSKKLTDVYFSSTVTVIGANVLLGCDNASSLTIADSNASYSTDGNFVYRDNRLILAVGAKEGVAIRNDTTGIESGAFMYNTAIREITIPDSVTEIKDKAFNGCSNLVSLHIGSGLKTLDSTAFSLLSSLKTITVSPDNEYFFAENGILYSKDGKSLILAAACNGMTEIRIRNGVTEISDYAFSCHKTLQNVVLPEGIKSIGDYSFYDCRGVEYLYCCRSLESIGAYAFSFSGPLSGNSKTMYGDVLKRVLFYDNLKTIGDSAFYGQYGIEFTFFKMRYLQLSVLLRGSGSNSGFFTHGCSDGKGGYYNNSGFGIICALYSENEPTIDYDGYEWFYFENGVPALYKRIPGRR